MSERRLGVLEPPVLLVEGPDDYHFIGHFWAKAGVAARFNVYECGGDKEVLNIAPTTLKSATPQKPIGIVLDADADLAARWQAVRDRLRPLGYVLPADPNPAGTIVAATDRPIAGVWLMPDNRLPGSLEHFVELMVPGGDALWPRATATVDGIPVDQRRFGAALQKAYVHTWLAWQAEPGTPLGQAVTKAYLALGSPAAARFQDWLQRLFG